jgi:hypothetical protein
MASDKRKRVRDLEEAAALGCTCSSTGSTRPIRVVYPNDDPILKPPLANEVNGARTEQACPGCGRPLESVVIEVVYAEENST